MRAAVHLRARALGDVRALGAAIGCIAIYAVTMGLAYPLVSLILESQGTDRFTIGLVAAAPSLAMLLATPVMPALVRRTGLRAFLAACIAADLLLFLALPALPGIASWFVLRLLAGAAGAGLFVAAETWINEAAREESRGRVIGIYTTVVAGGMALGSLVIPMVGIQGWTPFLTGAAFIALSTLPLLLTGSEGRIESVAKSGFGIFGFVRIAPILAAAIVLAAFKDTAGFALLPVFGVRSGLGLDPAATTLTVVAVGAVVSQIPIGMLADRWNRHALLVACGACGGLGALALPAAVGSPWLLWPLLFAWGGAFAGVYTVAMVILGQRFRGPELVVANAALAFLWGAGSLAGPVLCGAAMDRWDPDGFAASLAAASAAFVGLACVSRWRSSR